MSTIEVFHSKDKTTLVIFSYFSFMRGNIFFKKLEVLQNGVKNYFFKMEQIFCLLIYQTLLLLIKNHTQKQKLVPICFLGGRNENSDKRGLIYKKA